MDGTRSEGAWPITAWPRRAGLPEAIAFLRPYISDERILHAAARNARGSDVTAALLAGGGVSDTVYFCSLARHLALPFVQGWPELDRGQDAARALQTGRVRLADDGWLLAPTAEALRVLLAARRLGLPLPATIAIATPAHLAALVGRRLPVQIAHRVGSALAEAAPHLSARDALRGLNGAACCLVATLCLAGLASGVRPVADLFGLVFFAALVFRLLVSAAGWQGREGNVRAHGRSEPALPDERLPLYSVLVPLRDEAAVVPGLVAALAALDYPRAKLDIVFLVEADDGSTRLALLAAGVAPHMRVFTVPAGAPRTKPRALNAGLLLARGTLLTVYDAEDRPDRDQLRRAAARFALAPDDLVCLQARLTVSNGGGASLLPHGIMEHLPQAA